MGSETTRAVAAADDLSLVAELGSADPLDLLVDAHVEVAVDFTVPSSVMDNLAFCVRHGISAVVGTTGFDEHLLSTLRDWLREAPSVGVLVAPNSASGRS